MATGSQRDGYASDEGTADLQGVGSGASAGRLSMKLLCPAGGPEQLDMALHFGADEVYLAGRRWGMRARSKNFTRDQLERAVQKAHAAGVSVHLTLNTIMTDDDLDQMPDYLHFIDDIGVDAAIVADLGCMALLREHAPHVQLHVSTQASVMNARAAMEYVRLGATRIVLARELDLRQIAQIRRRIPRDVELEVFAHGSMCMAISGRCLLSSGLVGRERGANTGACTQPCRWNWTLVEEERPQTRRLPVEQDDRFSYILSSNDLMMLDHLADLQDAGVDAIKLEGRAKGAFYTAMITNAYRHVLDGEPASAWLGELETTSHRPFSTGFFYGNPTQNPGHVDYLREALMVATVTRCVPCAPGVDSDPADAAQATPPAEYLVEVLCRNKAQEGDTVQAVCAGRPVQEVQLRGLEHWDALAGWERTGTLSRAMERYRFRSPFPMEPLDILRK
ncbi:MAG: U32 family peptidase [Atopobiaceae bacterium]